VRWAIWLATALAGYAALLLPAAWSLRRRRPAVAHGAITTIEDAVVACRRAGLHGWPQVTLAQQLVSHTFRYYSCRNLWDTPAQAFRFGMGYCTQYNLALKQILDRLDFETQTVFSLHVRVVDTPEWTMGHTWLRVRIGGEVREVCAGSPGNLPGRVNFTPVAPVWQGHRPLLLLTHLGMILFCGFLEWRALLTRRPLPSWMFFRR
jgi:hypothetical protein